MATIRDVAKRAGVSVATVSLVLNNGDTNLPISESTKRRVHEAAKVLRYHPNSYAKALRTKKSYVVGILAFDIVDPYCAHVLRGAEDTLSESGYYPMISDLRNDEQKLHSYIRLFRERRVEGLLILASSLGVEDRLIFDLQAEKIPLVVIGREVDDPEVPTVVTDNINGAYQATEYLIELGHRQFGFVLGPSDYVDSRQRWKGSQRALEEHGIRVSPDLLIEEREIGWGPEAGYSSMKRLLQTSKKITAVVAFDDISAFGAIRAIYETGLRVPEDISVVGFDDLPVAAFYNPPLTTVQYSMVEMGRMGAQMLLGQWTKKNSGAKTNRVMPESRLVIRKSAAAPAS
jgi:DNA-binding LacI/PurR family transcriptional regulator